MKQFLLIMVVMFAIATFFIIDDEKSNNSEKRIMSDKTSNDNTKISEAVKTDSQVKAMYFSYIELEEYIKGKDEITAKRNIDAVIENMSSDGFNWLLLQVRPFSDSIYPSAIFPNSSSVTDGELPFDILAYFIEKAHAKNIEVHAWINPYRISNQTDFKIPEKHPAHQFLNTKNIAVIDGKGIFYNPASDEVINLITSGVEEIIDNYDVDGIHFDDYFFPGGDIDKIDYASHKEKGGTMSLSEYRLNNTTKMIASVHDVIKKKNKDILFGIAPEGNLENNYTSNYLDTKKLLSSDEYLDYIMPQLYFGFLNQNRPYVETIKEWSDLIKVDSLYLIPALALYKSGNDDKYAGSGRNEWKENDDIIKRQILYSQNIEHFSGFSLFRYDFFYNLAKQNDNMKSEVNNLRSLIK